MNTVRTEHRLVIEEYERRTEILKIELLTLQSTLDEQKAVSDLNVELQLELEREKGKLTGKLSRVNLFLFCKGL